MKATRFSGIAKFVGVFGLLAVVGCAQTNTATVTGVLTDPTHATVAHAKLEIREVRTGVVRSTESNLDGQFTFNFLPIGTYDLTAEATGFQRVDRGALELAAGQVL